MVRPITKQEHFEKCPENEKDKRFQSVVSRVNKGLEEMTHDLARVFVVSYGYYSHAFLEKVGDAFRKGGWYVKLHTRPLEPGWSKGCYLEIAVRPMMGNMPRKVRSPHRYHQ